MIIILRIVHHFVLVSVHVMDMDLVIMTENVFAILFILANIVNSLMDRYIIIILEIFLLVLLLAINFNIIIPKISIN